MNAIRTSFFTRHGVAYSLAPSCCLSSAAPAAFALFAAAAASAQLFGMFFDTSMFENTRALESWKRGGGAMA